MQEHTYLARLESIDETRLSYIRITNQSDRDLLLIGMQSLKLPQQLDKSALSEWVSRAGMECYGRIFGGEVGDVSCLDAVKANSVSILCGLQASEYEKSKEK